VLHRKAVGKDSRMRFSPAKKEKISTGIIRQIRSAILSGKLPPGSALPSEKDLIVQFKVSKHTLREALRVLEGMGLLQIRRGAGGGPVVRETDWETARESFTNFFHFQDVSFEDLAEMREILEPYVAARAARMMTPEMAGELCKVHEECEALYERDKPLVGAEAEVMFHVLLAKYTKNPILWFLLDFVNNTLVDVKLRLKPDREFCRKVIVAHRKILSAIMSGNSADAAEYMRGHIREVTDELGVLLARLSASGGAATASAAGGDVSESGGSPASPRLMRRKRKPAGELPHGEERPKIPSAC
jgi:GntR family transcriptional repressor for pyruvate dehydrogenase complex